MTLTLSEDSRNNQSANLAPGFRVRLCRIIYNYNTMASPADDTAQAVSDNKAQPRNESPNTPAETDERQSEQGLEDGEVETESPPSGPPLPNEAVPDGPPLPSEPVPQVSGEDDGWDCQWDPNSQSWFFYNRFSGKMQWDNPRVPAAAAVASAPGVAPKAATTASSSSTMLPPPPPPAHEKPAAGGYNPAIHGDYDPNAWYAQGSKDEDDEDEAALQAMGGGAGGVAVAFNRHTGAFQTEDQGPGRHTDEAKSQRQMNAFFDVDAAANSHDGRSLKAERSGKKPSKAEVKAFKEKRRARKEEKRRAWLRD